VGLEGGRGLGMEYVYFGLFHAFSPALPTAISQALQTYGNVEVEEWGAFYRLQSIDRRMR
jgi:hypothetical protein